MSPISRIVIPILHSKISCIWRHHTGSSNTMAPMYRKPSCFIQRKNIFFRDRLVTTRSSVPISPLSLSARSRRVLVHSGGQVDIPLWRIINGWLRSCKICPPWFYVRNVIQTNSRISWSTIPHARGCVLLCTVFNSPVLRGYKFPSSLASHALQCPDSVHRSSPKKTARYWLVVGGIVAKPFFRNFKSMGFCFLSSWKFASRIN